MKLKNYFLPAIIFALLLSSCSSISITQKRYSRGLNIDWFSAKDKKQEITSAKKSPKKKTVVAGKEADVAVASPASEEHNEIIVPTQNSQVTAEQGLNENKLQEKKVAPKSIRETLRESGVVKKGQRRLNEIRAKSSYNNASHVIPMDSDHDSDVALILLVILAILPPLTLLAIYLYFGEINSHFWINLLLLLLAGGAFAGGAAFGIGIPIIHALLVVFGVFG